MNVRMLVYILGKVLLIEGVLMVLPVICGCFYGESQLIYYIALAAIYIGIGLIVSRKKPKNMFTVIAVIASRIPAVWKNLRDTPTGKAVKQKHRPF
jgi:Trk-type K+ transport system membrane component